MKPAINGKKFKFTEVIIAAAAIILWCCAIFAAENLEKYTTAVSARWMSGGVSPAALSRQERFFIEDKVADMPRVTLWRENSTQRFSAANETTITGVVTEFFGHARDICTGEIIAGGYPSAAADDGCLISEGAAHALWGNVNVLGSAVTWAGTEYFVTGVFRGGENQLITPSNADNTATFANMQIAFEENSNRESAERYLDRAGFRGAVFLDTPLIGWAVKFFCFVPCIFLLISVVIKIFSRLISLGSYPRLFGIFLAPTVLTVAACGYLLGGMGEIPSHVIPVQLSDFDFYIDLWKSNADEIKNWFAAPTPRDFSLAFHSLAAVFLVALSLIFFAVCAVKIKIKSLPVAVAASFGSMILMFAMIFVFGGVIVPAGIWLSPSLWALSDYGLYLHKQYLTPRG